MNCEILIGDCREVLKSLPDESVQCCVTSPPFYGLRDYGTATWEGGREECDHVKSTAASKTSTLKNDGRPNPGSNNYEHSIIVPFREVCGKCGARRIDQQIGLEKTPGEFVAQLVQVFREVRRVLKSDGTLWLNLGDSYANDTKWGGSTSGKHVQAQHGNSGIGRCRQNTGLKPKDLIGIPWRVAFALQADGWYLRQDIIWAKPNPMPESVTDRCTKSHEYIFLLSKSPSYYYDQEAILEPVSKNTHARLSQDVQAQIGSERANGGGGAKTNGNMKAVGRKFDPGPGNKNNESFDAAMAIMPDKRNKRSVWTVTTQPYKEAHFATYPPDLIKPCILAGTRAGDVVLDPFGGSGTTGQVAIEFGRSAILIELNEQYAGIANKRTDVTPGLALA